MHLPRVLLVSIVVVLLARSSPAEQTSGGQGPPPPPPGALPSAPAGPFADADFGEVLVGEFTHDFGVDGLMINDGLLTLAMSVEVFRTSVIWSGGVAHDFAAFARDDAPDRLFVVADGGLHELVWNLATRDWDTLTIATGDWTDARRLACADFDGDGMPDLVGLAADAVDPRLVLVRQDDDAGGLASTDATFTTSDEALDVFAIDWDGLSGDGDELVFVTTGGLELREPDGTLLGYFAWPYSPPLVAVLDDPALASQRLAIIIESSPGGAQYVLVSDIFGNELVTGLAGQRAVAVAGADMDGDLDTDLLLSLETTTAVGVFTARSDLEPGGPFSKTFAPGTLQLVPFGDPARDASLNHAGLAATDFDHDGQPEIFAPAQGNWVDGDPPSGVQGEIVLIDFASQVETDLRVALVERGVELVSFGGGEPEFFQRFSYLAPAEQLVPGEGQSLRLQVKLFTAPDLWEPTDVDPKYVGDFELAPPLTAADLLLPVSELGTIGESVLRGWVIRQVILEGGEVVARGPATTAVDAFGTNIPYLWQLGGWEYTLRIVPYGGGSSGFDGETNVGATVPRFEDDTPIPPDR